MRWPVGLCLAAFADEPLEVALGRAHELGFTLVDLPTDSPFRIRPSGPQGGEAQPSAHGDGIDLDRLRSLLAQFDMEVGCVSNSRDAQLILGPHGPLTDPISKGDPDAKRDHGLRHAREAIEVAAAVGSPLVRLFLGCPDHARWLRWPGSPESWDDNVEAFVEAAVPLAEAAQRSGVRLCVEPHPKQVVFDAPSLRACVAGLEERGAHLHLCFDPANLAALHHDPVDVLTAAGVVPVCVHAKDVEVSSSADPPVGPGWVRYGPQPAVRFRGVPWGELDWRAIVTRLQEIGFEGPVMIEHEDLVTDRITGITGARRHLEALDLGPLPDAAWW